jgi:hypothetical protein
VSYLSPVAQSLLNRKVGEQVEFEIHGVRHHHRIEAIEAFQIPAVAVTAPSAASPSATPA